MRKIIISISFSAVAIIGCGGGGTTVTTEELQNKTLTDTEHANLLAGAVLAGVASTSSINEKITINDTYPVFEPSDNIDWGWPHGTTGDGDPIQDYYDLSCTFSGEQTRFSSGRDWTANIQGVERVEYGLTGTTCSYLQAGYGDDPTGIKEHNPCDYNIYVQMVSGTKYEAHYLPNVEIDTDAYYSYVGSITFRIIAEKDGTTVQVGSDTTCDYNILETWVNWCQRYTGTICGHDISEFLTHRTENNCTNDYFSINWCQAVTGQSN